MVWTNEISVLASSWLPYWMAIMSEVKMAVRHGIATISLSLENVVRLDFYFFLVEMILQFWSFQRNQLAARMPNQDMHKVN